MCLLSLGSSPSQMIEVWLARPGRCRSMQLYAAFSVPSSNHLIDTLPGPNEVFLTLRNGVIQVMRLACSPQKPFGSATECSYISRYFGSLMVARCFHSAGIS